MTTTTNYTWGSGIVIPGTDIWMNNEMDDFSMRPGTPNVFGLVGSEANSIAAGKRPLSSMSPTIVRDLEGNNRIVIGARGGPRITSSVFLSLVNRLYFGMYLPEAIFAPRFHHQWKPASLFVEQNGFSAETLRELRSYGYDVRSIVSSAAQHALERSQDGRVWGVVDPRAEGAAVAQ